MMKNKESSYLKYSDGNSLYGWAMPQKFSVNGFESINHFSQFNEDFIKTMMKKVVADILNINIKNYMNFIMISRFYQKEENFKKAKSLLLIYMIKLNMLFT